jgi:hypothetical protein
MDLEGARFSRLAVAGAGVDRALMTSQSSATRPKGGILLGGITVPGIRRVPKPSATGEVACGLGEEERLWGSVTSN